MNGLTIAFYTSKAYLEYHSIFFVNWSSSTEKITPYAWIKRILPKASIDYIRDGITQDKELIDSLVETEGTTVLELQVQFYLRPRLVLQYILFRNIDWASSPEHISFITINYSNSKLVYSVETLDINQLMTRIQLYSGGPINIGNKGLIYSTSTLECFLSKTKSLYPGDADLIIFRIDNFDAVELLEFKKHNLSDPIDGQRLDKYYPRPDERKYKRLAILRDFLGQSVQLKCMYYPTSLNDFGKLELINGPSKALVSGKASRFHLPRIRDTESYTRVIKGVVGYK